MMGFGGNKLRRERDIETTYSRRRMAIFTIKLSYAAYFRK